MTRLLPVSGRKMCKIPEKLGFEKIHQLEAMQDTGTPTEGGSALALK